MRLCGIYQTDLWTQETLKAYVVSLWIIRFPTIGLNFVQHSFQFPKLHFKSRCEQICHFSSSNLLEDYWSFSSFAYSFFPSFSMHTVNLVLYHIPLAAYIENKRPTFCHSGIEIVI